MNNRGVVYTFYSYKGGVGRSMALANVAALLAKNQKRVLVIDWDLEAPGLETYFSSKTASLSSSRKDVPGIMDLVTSFAQGDPLDWRSCLLYAHPFNDGLPISILTAGQESEDYVNRVRNTNWEYLFNEKGFGSYLESLREQWITAFDFILIDSRTGITDIGGICTIHLPDILVLLFTANEQSLAGVIEVMRRASKRYSLLPLDRAQLLGLPIPSRFENSTEYRLAAEWKGIFAERLNDIYKDWLPDRTTAADVLEKLFIPYIPFWSFGEGLPVVTEGTSDPRSLGFAYNVLARMLESRLQWKQALKGEIFLSGERAPELIDQDAERVYESLPLIEREMLREIFVQLVRVGQTPDEDVRRKVPESEFDHNNLIERLVDARLLYKGVDTLTKEPLIEIAQEALLKNWQRLRTWIDENREFLMWRQDLHSRMLEWRASDFDPNLLLSGAGLSKAERIKSLRGDELTSSEREFIHRSATEKDRQRSKERRNRIIAQVPYLVLISVLITFGFYWYQEQSRSSREQESRLMDLMQRQREAQSQAAALAEQLQRLQEQNNELTKELVNLRRNR